MQTEAPTEAAAEKGAIYIGHGVLDSLLNYLGALDCLVGALVPRDPGKTVVKAGGFELLFFC